MGELDIFVARSLAAERELGLARTLTQRAARAQRYCRTARVSAVPVLATGWSGRGRDCATA